MSGKLYLCATPIGNLDDITLRVLETLKTADLIAAEDTRHTIKLLNHFDIKTPMTSYHEYNKVDKARYLVGQMQQGVNIALVTDAGTPGISDPGEELVRQCYEAGILVTSLPGPAACITALTLSGLPTRRFCFEAFLPTDKKERQWILEELKQETRTMIVYEAPHHLVRTLEELGAALGMERRLTLCRELTKRYEEAYQATFAEALQRFETEEPKGECVIVIEGRSIEDLKREQQKSWEEMSLEDHMEVYLTQGMDRKEAMKKVAKDRGISKRDVYQGLMERDEYVNRIGGTRAVYKLARTALCLKMIEMGRALLRIIMCECTVVGSGNYINRTGFHLTAFNHRDCRHMSRRLIGMSPAKYQERTSLFFTLHHIDSCIAECTF